MRGDAKCVRRVIERPFAFFSPCSARRRFSHLVLFSARIGDAWPIIALCSGRAAMGAQPWPVRSLVCVSLAVKCTPSDGMRGSTVQSMMDAVIAHGTLQYILDDNHNNPAKRCKQLGYLQWRRTKHCPLQFQLTCQG